MSQIRLKFILNVSEIYLKTILNTEFRMYKNHLKNTLKSRI